MMLCKILYKVKSPFLMASILMSLILLFSSCGRDIDYKIRKCYNSNDTIINLSDLYPEDWDTVYFFTDACEFPDIEKRVGPVIRRLYVDVGDRLLILNKQNRAVCYKEVFPNYGQKYEGALFDFGDDSPIFAVPREKAKFHISKIDDDCYLVELIK